MAFDGLSQTYAAPREAISMDNASVVPRDMPFHLLEEITNGFSEERKLGTGACGKVYLVWLSMHIWFPAKIFIY